MIKNKKQVMVQVGANLIDPEEVVRVARCEVPGDAFEDKKILYKVLLFGDLEPRYPIWATGAEIKSLLAQYTIIKERRAKRA